MRIVPDTNVLIRAAVLDELDQARVAAEMLAGATVIAISLHSLCEFVWVLRSVYRYSPAACAHAMASLLGSQKVLADRSAIRAGLEFLEAGGDFADGVIAHEGRRLGGDLFVSFDRKAVQIANSQGFRARRL